MKLRFYYFHQQIQLMPKPININDKLCSFITAAVRVLMNNQGVLNNSKTTQLF